MNIHSSSNQAYFSPLHSINGVDQAARDKQIGTEKNTDTSDKIEPTNTQQINPEENKLINELRKIDQEVRAHEMAHLAAAGGLSKGGATFEYQRGPDGQQYAVAGEVQIDTSSVSGNPEATLQKAQQIQQAALAPAQPSAQDRSVAVAAAAMAAEARAEIASQNTSNDRNMDNDQDETSFQRIITKVDEAYGAITDADTQRTASLIDLIA